MWSCVSKEGLNPTNPTNFLNRCSVPYACDILTVYSEIESRSKSKSQFQLCEIEAGFPVRRLEIFIPIVTKQRFKKNREVRSSSQFSLPVLSNDIQTIFSLKHHGWMDKEIECFQGNKITCRVLFTFVIHCASVLH